jgi:hypothetical protein
MKTKKTPFFTSVFNLFKTKEKLSISSLSLQLGIVSCLSIETKQIAHSLNDW